jgi:hypothetical protein
MRACGMDEVHQLVIQHESLKALSSHDNTPDSATDRSACRCNAALAFPPSKENNCRKQAVKKASPFGSGRGMG